MKTTKVAVVFLLFVAIASCRKNNDKKANCKIATVVQTSANGTLILNLTYNNEGRLSTIFATGTNGFNKVFTYNGNTMIVNTTAPDGSFSTRDSVTFDAKRKPLNIRQFFNESLQNWNNSAFEYSGDNLQKIITTGSSTTGAETQIATMVNGNMTSLQAQNSISTLEYFTDKKVQQGDFLELSSILQYGVGIYPHKNLLKTIANGPNILNLNYDFNSDGTISRVVVTSGGSVVTITYQYQCS